MLRICIWESQVQTLHFEKQKVHKHKKLSSYGIRNGSIMNLVIDIDGGAGAAKRHREDDDTGSIPIIMSKPVPKDGDLPEVLEGIAINVAIEPWVASLSLADLRDTIE